ncbi:MAG: hypothetical protein EOO69_01030 [Moraxellaceae bacterium]|nr:MAG: hypothetical protein EOO69_01030 [Moraxellaceae bacterium]
MKTLRVLAVSAAVLVATSPAFADEKVVTDEGVATFSFFKPASVRAEVGTTGYGGAVSYNVNPYVGLTAGYNGGDISWTDNIKVDGTEYDLDMDNNTAYLNAEIRPWANWFYMAAGTAYIDNDYDLQKRIGAGDTLSINGDNYQLATGTGEGGIRGKMNYKNNIAPYLGLGFSPSITDRFGVFGEIGAYYVGNPEVNLDQYNLAPVAGNPVLAETAKNRLERDIRNDDKYKWLPVAKLGLSLRF